MATISKLIDSTNGAVHYINMDNVNRVIATQNPVTATIEFASAKGSEGQTRETLTNPLAAQLIADLEDALISGVI